MRKSAFLVLTLIAVYFSGAQEPMNPGLVIDDTKKKPAELFNQLRVVL